MANIKLKSSRSARITSPAPSQQTRLSRSQIDQIRRIAGVRHGRALLRSLIDYYDCDTTESRCKYFDNKLKRIMEEFDDMDKSELARDATQLIHDLWELYGTDGLKKELKLAFGKRG